MRHRRNAAPVASWLSSVLALVQACDRHRDCGAGDYCDSNHNCFACSFVSGSSCDAMDDGGNTATGACCTEEFLHKCPANPRRCSCVEHADCAPGWFCSDAVPPGGAWTCRPCGAAALTSTPPLPAARRGCPALGSRCCGRDYLRQCPAAPQACPCSHHDDCVRGMYCAQGGLCATCSGGVNTTHCASFDADCCSAAFLRHCDDPLFPRTNVNSIYTGLNVYLDTVNLLKHLSFDVSYNCFILKNNDLLGIRARGKPTR